MSDLEVVGIDSGVEVLESLDVGPKVGCNGAEGVSLDDRVLACAGDVDDFSDLEIVRIDSRIEVFKGLDTGSKVGRNGAQSVTSLYCVSGHDEVMSLLLVYKVQRPSSLLMFVIEGMLSVDDML